MRILADADVDVLVGEPADGVGASGTSVGTEQHRAEAGNGVAAIAEQVVTGSRCRGIQAGGDGAGGDCARGGSEQSGTAPGLGAGAIGNHQGQARKRGGDTGEVPASHQAIKSVGQSNLVTLAGGKLIHPVQIADVRTVEHRRTVFHARIKAVLIEARVVLVEQAVIEGAREGVIGIHQQASGQAFGHGHQQSVVVGGTNVGTHEFHLRLIVVIRLEAQRTPVVPHLQEDGAHVTRREGGAVAAEHILGGAGTDGGELVFEEWLVGNTGDRCAGAQLGADKIVGLGEGLPGRRILKHVGRLGQVDGMRQIAGEAAHISYIHHDATGQLTLHTEVEIVAASQLAVGVHLERECFAEVGGDHRDACGQHNRQGNGSVNAHAIRGDGRVGRGGIATDTGRGGIAFRAVYGNVLSKANSQHGNQHVLDQVGTVEDQAEAAADHGLAVAC